MNNIEIKVVIGSWGSYNECNDRALGSTYINFADFTDWTDIEEILTQQGFELNGIDEELFVQDIEGLPSDCANWNFVNPQKLFETLYESGALEEQSKYDTMLAFLEARSFDEFQKWVDSSGYHWDDRINLYEGYDWSDYGRLIFENAGYDIPNEIVDYIDFEQYGEDCGINYAEKYSGGIIEIQD